MHIPGLHVKTNGDLTPVDLTVHRVTADLAEPLEAPLYLVILEQVQPHSHEPARLAGAQVGKKADRPGPADADASITKLQQELQAKEEHLQTIFEELETSNEELKSSNEEMQSVNEELQSHQ